MPLRASIRPSHPDPRDPNPLCLRQIIPSFLSLLFITILLVLLTFTTLESADVISDFP